jgi:hypothetical protein
MPRFIAGYAVAGALTTALYSAGVTGPAIAAHASTAGPAATRGAGSQQKSPLRAAAPRFRVTQRLYSGTLPASGTADFSVSCHPDEFLIGGGAEISAPGQGVTLANGPTGFNGWHVLVADGLPGEVVTVWAYCRVG